MLKKIICLMSLAIACVAFDSSSAFAGGKKAKAAANGGVTCPVKGFIPGRFKEGSCTGVSCKDPKQFALCAEKCGGADGVGMANCKAAHDKAAGGSMVDKAKKKAKKGGDDAKKKAAEAAAKAKAAEEAAAAKAKADEEAAAATAAAATSDSAAEPAADAPPADAPPADAPPPEEAPPEEAPADAPPAEEAPAE